MGKAIVIGLVIVVIAAILAGVAMWMRTRDSKDTALEKGLPLKGDLTARQERRILEANDKAADVMHQLLYQPLGMSLESTLLSTTDRAAIETWLRENVDVSNIRKGISS